jgi:hypothetical protein
MSTYTGSCWRRTFDALTLGIICGELYEEVKKTGSQSQSASETWKTFLSRWVGTTKAIFPYAEGVLMLKLTALTARAGRILNYALV